ncbi:MAG TPA: UvrB/UvrC motif-containing protein [Bacillota bacterium]|nr:UvrB/UvrC motif-containing protein [Bacillota bacterium]
MITCQSCSMRPATLHYTQVVNGEKTELHICDVCAGERGDLGFADFPASGFNIHSILAGLMHSEASTQGAKLRQELRCPVCGSDYRRFAEGGRLGCGECYNTFATQLTPLLKRIHGNCSHQGKIPSRGARTILARRHIEELRNELRQAVEQERYETAAQLRDKLRQLESER